MVMLTHPYKEDIRWANRKIELLESKINIIFKLLDFG